METFYKKFCPDGEDKKLTAARDFCANFGAPLFPSQY